MTLLCRIRQISEIVLLSPVAELFGCVSCIEILDSGVCFLRQAEMRRATIFSPSAYALWLAVLEFVQMAFK